MLLLLIPLALTIRDGNVPNVGWNWSPGDFIFAFVVIFGTGVAFELISKRMKTMQYKLATALGLFTAFVIVWGNAAVGIIGDGGDLDTPNILYFLALGIGLVFVFLSRLEPRGMARAMFVTAAALFLVPPVALVIFPPATTSWAPGIPQVFLLNAVLVAMFVGSGLLFLRSSDRI